MRGRAQPHDGMAIRHAARWHIRSEGLPEEDRETTSQSAEHSGFCNCGLNQSEWSVEFYTDFGS